MFGKLKPVLYFLAGAALWDAFVMYDLQKRGMLPITVGDASITPEVNVWVIASLVILSIGLVFIAYKLPCACKKA